MTTHPLSDADPGRLMAAGFCTYAVGKLRDSLANIERCARLLTDEQLWTRPNDVSNAIGNLLLHLAGNVNQWVGVGLGGGADHRDRPAEFAARGPLPAAECLGPLRAAIENACQIISGLDVAALLAEHEIQGRRVTGLVAVFHVVEHFSLHTGQIVLQTKLLTGRDLSLYDSQGLRLDTPPGTV